MTKWNYYRKKKIQMMRPYIPGEDLTGVSISENDTPKEDGMIACADDDPNDQWYINPKFFNENYELVPDMVVYYNGISNL